MAFRANQNHGDRPYGTAQYCLIPRFAYSWSGQGQNNRIDVTPREAQALWPLSLGEVPSPFPSPFPPSSFHHPRPCSRPSPCVPCCSQLLALLPALYPFDDRGTEKVGGRKGGIPPATRFAVIFSHSHFLRSCYRILPCSVSTPHTVRRPSPSRDVHPLSPIASPTRFLHYLLNSPVLSLGSDS